MTNIFDVIEELHPALAEHLVDAPRLGRCIQHPLVYSVPHYDQLNAFVNRQYVQKMQAVTDAIKQREWSQAIALHERPYRWDALLMLGGRMSDVEFWEMFGWVWTDSENIWQHSRTIRRILQCGRAQRHKMMSNDEQAALSALPSVVTVHRGHGLRNDNGLSWTLDRDKAAWFATRWKQRGWVTSGQVSRSNIIARFDGRGEQEVVCFPRSVSKKQKQEA